jgi:hypothetical protein
MALSALASQASTSAGLQQALRQELRAWRRQPGGQSRHGKHGNSQRKAGHKRLHHSGHSLERCVARVVRARSWRLGAPARLRSSVSGQK